MIDTSSTPISCTDCFLFGDIIGHKKMQTYVHCDEGDVEEDALRRQRKYEVYLASGAVAVNQANIFHYGLYHMALCDLDGK